MDKSKTAVDFFAELGVPEGIVPGEKVVLTILPMDYEMSQPKQSIGVFVGVTTDTSGKKVFIISPNPGIMQHGDEIKRIISIREEAIDLLEKHFVIEFSNPMQSHVKSDFKWVVNAIEEALTKNQK